MPWLWGTRPQAAARQPSPGHRAVRAMSGITSLLGELRAAGVSIRLEGERLIVEGPTGAVTPEMRAELVRRKAELVSALESDPGCPPREDPITLEAFREVAGLLALAYQRYAKIQRMPVDQPKEPPLQPLALSESKSVHGHGHVP